MTFNKDLCFKPYYKWNTFNTKENRINASFDTPGESFKPYYKWNTFNTGIEINGGQTQYINEF